MPYDFDTGPVCFPHLIQGLYSQLQLTQDPPLLEIPPCSIALREKA